MWLIMKKISGPYLKKSLRQNNLLSLEKHFSTRGSRQSKHLTHSACHVLSRTFSKNLSKMGLSQPAQAISIPAAGSHRPETTNLSISLNIMIFAINAVQSYCKLYFRLWKIEVDRCCFQYTEISLSYYSKTNSII